MKVKKNPVHDARNITIRLIRDVKEENQNTDDIIVIHHKGENIYHVYFQDGHTNYKSRYTMTVYDGDSLDIYMRSLFRLIATDRDPFKAVQFNIPGFPCLYYTPADFRRKVIRNKLMKLMPIQVGVVHVETN